MWHFTEESSSCLDFQVQPQAVTKALVIGLKGESCPPYTRLRTQTVHCSRTLRPPVLSCFHICAFPAQAISLLGLYSGSSAETSSWGEVGKSQRHSCSLWLSTQWFSTPSPCLLYSSQPQGPIKLLDPLICRSLNREMTPRFVLIHFALNQYAVPWRKIEQGNQQFLCFSLFLTLLQWVVFVFVFIKGFTVTFVLVCCCFNQLFQCLSSSALSSLAKLLTSKSIFSNGS